MANEALMQMIGQRPGMVLSGLAGARDEANERRMFELAQSQNIAQGILQAMGLWTDQQRFGAQMDEQQRQFNVQEGLDQPTPMGVYHGAPVPTGPAPQGYRAQAAGQAATRFGWETEDRPLERKSKDLGVQQQNLGVMSDAAKYNEFIGTMPLRESAAKLGIDEAELRNALLREQVDAAPMRREADAAALEGQRLQNEATGFNTERGRALFPGEVAAQEADLAEQQANADWMKRFGAAKSEDERYQIVGENPKAWLEMTLTGQRIEAQGAADQAKAGTPQDHALKELAQLREKFRTTAVTKATPMGGLLGDDAAAAAGDEVTMIDAAMKVIMTGKLPSGEAFVPADGESHQAYLGRVLTTLLRSGNEAGAINEDDDPFAVGASQ